jgi:hypothetical protein
MNIIGINCDKFGHYTHVHLKEFSFEYKNRSPREVVDLERCALSFVSTFEEVLGRKGRGSGLEAESTVVGIRHADHMAISIRKNWY